MSGKGGTSQVVKEAKGSDNQDEGGWGDEGDRSGESPRSLDDDALEPTDDEAESPTASAAITREDEDTPNARRTGEWSQDEDALRAAAEEAERKRKEIQAGRLPLPGAFVRESGPVKKGAIPDMSKAGGKKGGK